MAISVNLLLTSLILARSPVTSCPLSVDVFASPALAALTVVVLLSMLKEEKKEG